ncbi:DIE2/ALG10 family-domain-containing protein [Pseudomassariella vexata]|uniref:Dol-P-Glc:Glc(2)Man(9)GlcNAc(2)-PP-Dol alpha-1,2-glucosyltransferase n=1 Tax=Pseudomassariella vexata TaxID=1141098 RepID=A0A1Y2DFS8_9PEZI|nr:DIE2/ALG10 family-domain-containing protein [Pseudomassariella vexata]ORY58131.1 DIE2/ALG10 family-domain-containing protein [Pseudomassariella vexata]
MASVVEILDLLLSTSVLRSILAAAFLGYALWARKGAQPGRATSDAFNTHILNYAAPFIVPAVLSRVWLYWVNKTVPEPYLDEFFHIPQAQAYCEGKYLEWDDKITTPPGLYIFSIIWARVLGYEDCSAETQRKFNAEAIALTALLAGACRAAIEQPKAGASQRHSGFAIHTAVNVALFPALFFFSGLYYTDVLSTCVVLVAYRNHLARVNRSNDDSSLLNDIYTICLGVLALFMRQTNIFWVVVYMGALEAVQAIKSLKTEQMGDPQFATLTEKLKFFAWRYSQGDIHDPSLHLAWPTDLLACVISVGIALIGNLPTVLRRVYPHVAVLGLFAMFVTWNGGVVLGDKSNHVATIHLAQMLYIWPLFAFFSFPLFQAQLPHLLSMFFWLFAGQSNSAAASSEISHKDSAQPEPLSVSLTTAKLTKHSRPGPQLSPNVTRRPTKQPRVLQAFNYLGSLFKVHSVIVIALCLVAAFLIVHFNTIIHPFTLADNRHYMFYIFRYTIRRDMVRYLLVPIYILCGWLCWSRLYGLEHTWLVNPGHISAAGQLERWYHSPFEKTGPCSVIRPDTMAGGQNTTSSQDRGVIIRQRTNGKHTDAPTAPLRHLFIDSTTPPPTSTILILLLATSLSLVTAPLVEPRYFILPWVFWRLLVPRMDMRLLQGCHSPMLQHISRLKFDPCLVLETMWFLAINAGTMYIFITRPFYWKSDDGTVLDGGNVQRFMW